MIPGAWLLALVLQDAPDVTLAGLLAEMVDPAAPARLPDPPYVARSWTSHDRRSVRPGEPAWFANVDRNQFLRTELRGGRPERVLVDAAGPGALVRIWATWVGGEDPARAGTLRLYLDGREEPEVTGEIGAFLAGGLLAGEPFGYAVPQTAPPRWRGRDLYLPVPYATRCVLTYEPSAPLAGPGEEGEVLYYQVESRAYAPGTRVRSFSRAELAELGPELERAGAALRERRAPPEAARELVLAPDAPFELELEGPAALSRLALRLEPTGELDLDQLLRSAVLELVFDDEPCVWAPVGDLFGTGHGLREYATRCSAARADGWLLLERTLPFARSARLRLVLTTPGAARGSLALETAPWEWDERSLHFHATWRAFGPVSTAGEKDEDGGEVPELTLVRLVGRGLYVGDVLTVTNGAPAWWGEGDEKIRVDGEAFPAHFGTGTEDYYGLAWGQAQAFSAPFHAQPIGVGNTLGGPTVLVRHRQLDAIPFERSLRFDLELFHHEETRVDVAATTLWYARPGATSDVAPDPAAAARPVPRSAEDVAPAPRREGALEGEELTVLSASGRTDVLHVPRAGWSNRRLLAWQAAEGGRLELALPVPRLHAGDGGDGARGLVLGLSGAPGNGVFDVLVDERPVAGGLDTRSETPTSLEVRLDGVALEPGEHRLLFVRRGGGAALGLDFVLLVD